MFTSTKSLILACSFVVICLVLLAVLIRAILNIKESLQIRDWRVVRGISSYQSSALQDASTAYSSGDNPKKDNAARDMGINSISCTLLVAVALSYHTPLSGLASPWLLIAGVAVRRRYGEFR